MNVLTRAEAIERAGLVDVREYDVELDLTTGATHFGSRTTVRFRCSQPGASTFVEIAGDPVHVATLNGRALDVPALLDGHRLRLPDLAAENELVVEAACVYSHSGEGLHRTVDPADGEAYTYSQMFLNDAQRVFACFDQPDLKAPWRLSVKAPPDWVVVSNGPGRSDGAGHWSFDPTPPVATYFTAVVAGPYHMVYADHDGIRLGVGCRSSLAPHLEAEEIFEVTRQSFDYYHELFGVRYPWTKYDQLFVPEFNAGAMENPGCVTFRDELVFRSRVTDESRELRAMIIAHEMAHMWFGDLVTMRWWDDLWLNESFAEYAGHRAAAEATRFTTAWASYSFVRKAWGYRQDQLPTTHPVAGDAPDTQSALLNFDGISYAKGAAVLRQLDAAIGREASARAYPAYFRAHAFANATIDDFLTAMGEAAGRDMGAWADAWIRTAGLNTLAADVTVDGDGRYASFAVEQGAPESHPTLRHHRIVIGLYGANEGRLDEEQRVEVDVAGERTEIEALVGQRAADLIVVNDEDLTWAKVRLDARSLETVSRDGVGALRSPVTRAVVWNSLREMLRDAKLAAGDFTALVEGGLPAETEIVAVAALLATGRQAIELFGDPSRRERRLASFVSTARRLLDGAPAGGDLQLALARAVASAAERAEDVDLVRGWLAGDAVPPGLVVDDEFRWIAVKRLAAVGAVDEAAIDAEAQRDRTAAGELHAWTARTSVPSSDAKEAAWRRLTEDDSLSNHVVEAAVAGFWQPHQVELTAPYAERWFEVITGLFASRPLAIALTLAGGLFPLYHVAHDALGRADALLARDDVAPALRRIVTERRADLDRALATRRADGATV